MLWCTLAALAVGVLLWLRYVDRQEKRARCTKSGVVDEHCLWVNETVERFGPKLGKLGPPLYSQDAEETLIRDFFQDRRGGTFVDIGAGHYKDASTTYYLEKHLGWKGIAVDAQESFAKGYADNRPGTKFFSYFVSDKTEADHPFFISSKWGLSSGSKEYVQRDGVVAKEVKIPAITLDDLLAHEKITKVDLLSMDIEQGEPAALAGFDIARFGVELVCIEMQPETKAAIGAYFEKHGYARVERYGAFDENNAYFAPKSSPRLRE